MRPYHKQTNKNPQTKNQWQPPRIKTPNKQKKTHTQKQQGKGAMDMVHLAECLTSMHEAQCPEVDKIRSSEVHL